MSSSQRCEGPSDTVSWDELITARRVDMAGAKRAVRDLLGALGLDVDADQFRRVPDELVRGLEKLLAVAHPEVTIRRNDGHSTELTMHSVRYLSLCPHLSPVAGTVRVGYLPREHLVGGGEFEEVVACMAHHPRLTTELTNLIADWVYGRLQPQGCAVLLEAASSCFAGCVGPMHQAHETTLATRGVFRDDPLLRRDFLACWSSGAGELSPCRR